MNDTLIGKLDTEKQNPDTLDIDAISTIEILKKINNEDKKVSYIVESQLNDIAILIDKAYESVRNGGRIIYIGAGTSGRLGILDASECPPTFGVSEELVQGIIAGGYDALLRAKEGAEDSKENAKKDLKQKNLTDKDIVIGLSASGRTPYVIGAIDYANKIGAQTGSICCVKNSEISKYAKYPIEVVTGAEVVTGSTRMKAGTAQKLILNMISTVTMIKYGKVYKNLMVDVRVSNEKLKNRALNIISELVGTNYDKTQKLFIESGKDVKTAIVMGLSSCDKITAQLALKSNDENITKAVNYLLKG